MLARRRSGSASRNDSNVGAGDSSDIAGVQQQQQQEESVTNIKVAVRCRPFSSSESSRGEQSCFRIENGSACLENPTNPSDIYRFGFDLIYGMDAEQVTVWRDVGVPAMEKAFAGFNTTIFAYGQTGSGKTFSMQGVEGGNGEKAGIIPRMNEELFARVAREREADGNKMFLVTCSYFEIYNEVIYDLLDPNNRKRKGAGLEIREHGVLGIFVKGLQEMVVTSPDSMQRLIDQGMASRTVGSTAMNDTSSRSHSVFNIKVHQKDATDESKSTFAKINLVDLAGSERAKSTGATGARLKEGANINKSLSSLGNVINALVDVANGKKGVFVPYRNSKLTRVLQESLGGNSLTAMLAALSPAACNFEETLSTLKYASRAKSIKVNAVKNEEASQVSRLQEEIRLLKQKLLAQEQTASASSLSSPSANNGASEVPAGNAVNGGDVPVGDGRGGGSREGRNGDDGSGGGDRYKQQIAEMEAAMKSTWEEKAKQSESSERERQRLQQQLEEEARREERGRKKRWRALEDKGDLELSIREVKEVALPTLPAMDWLGQVRALVAAENRAREEATVCAVYQEALARELESVFSGHTSTSGPLPTAGAVGGDLEDDRASVASTICTAISEGGSVTGAATAPAAAAAFGGEEGNLQDGDSLAAGGGVGGVCVRRAIKAITNYDPALLRQLQARITSLRNARERLHGPLEKAVEEGSEKLLESVDLFSARFAASPHEHVEREDGGSGQGGGGTKRRGSDGSASEGRGAGGGVAGGGSEKGQAALRQKRWEAKREESSRALAMIRRQVVARARRTREHWRFSGSSSSAAVAEAVGQRTTTLPETANEGNEEIPTAGMTEVAGVAAITARFAEAESLYPAAVIIARAVESVLQGSTSAFGGGGGVAAVIGGESPPLAEGVAEAVANGLDQKNEDIDMEGGEGSQAERDRYRDILEGLSRAHGALLKALETAAGSSCAPAKLGGGGETAVVAEPFNKKITTHAEEAGGNERSCRVTEESTQEGGTTSSSTPRAGVLPRSSCWGFKCSSGGRVEGGEKQGEEHEENNDTEVEDNRGCFTWETGAASESGESGKGEQLLCGDNNIACGSAPVPSPWVELDFGEVVAVEGLEFRPLIKECRGTVHKLVPDSIKVAGFGEYDADGSIERTEAMIGEVMEGWGRILKSTPPAKLLSRPPVRFLYDLFRTVTMTTGFGEEDEVCGAKWEDLVGKKDKMRLMDRMVQLVVDTLALETRPAKGSDIVIGQECVATNRFLQLLALAARHHQNRRGQAQGVEQSQTCSISDKAEAGRLWAELTARKKIRLAIAASADGITWAEETFVGPKGNGDETTGKNSIGINTLTLKVTAVAVRCRHLRLTSPTAGSEANDDNFGAVVSASTDVPDHDFSSLGTVPAAPAFDPGTPTSEHGASAGNASTVALNAFQVRVIEPREGKEGIITGQDGARRRFRKKDKSQELATVGSLLEMMHSTVGRLLEQSVEWGRIEAAYQERKTAMRTNKMESLEKRLKASTEAKSRLARDKKAMAVKAARTEEENLKLQEQVLRLRADMGRERMENASITERLTHAEQRVEEEQSRVRELEDLKRHLDGETEDLQNQVEVLTEERDVARSHEEELFAKLTDRTEDLEALQESYVSLTDRWNDFQDEHDEVLEQLESFRAALNLSSNSNSRKNDGIPQTTATNGATDSVGRIHTGDSRPPLPGLDDCIEERNQRGMQLEARGEGGEPVRDSRGEEGRSRNSHAPPRPASGSTMALRTSGGSYDDGNAGDFGNNSRNQSCSSTARSLDEGLRPGTSSTPRRPSSVSSSVQSPAADGQRRRESDYAEDVDGERSLGRDGPSNKASSTHLERKKHSKSPGDSIENRDKMDSDNTTDNPFTVAAAEISSNVLHGGDSGGYYEDDFDDFVELESEEDDQRQGALRDTTKEKDEMSGRGASGEKRGRNPHNIANANGGGHVVDGNAEGNKPLVEVVYRPPSGGSRGKVERPKSAARQGRSASLNVAV